MDRSPGFGSIIYDLIRPVQTRFRFDFAALPLNLAYHRNSPARSTKSTRSRLIYIVALSLLVSIRFQVLFHSPPGVLFTFPSRYYTLSVTWSYLAFGDGPPFFRQDSSCPDVLRLRLAIACFRLRGCYPLRRLFPKPSPNFSSLSAVPKPFIYFYIKFGLFRFRSPLLSESMFLSFPPGN